jgi:CRP-like cAMP-binding protein
MNYKEMTRLGLFKGMNAGDIRKICECFGAYTREFKKGETVICEGDAVKSFGVVVGGSARSYKTDINGSIFTVALIGEGGYIGILLAGLAAEYKHSPVTVEATDRLTVLFVPFRRLIKQCGENCSHHNKIMNNFICGVSAKAMLLYERIDCLIQPTTREKVLAFLLQQSPAGESFEIGFDRERLAEYLNVDRSALSRELSRMKKDGVIEYNRSRFTVLI